MKKITIEFLNIEEYIHFYDLYSKAGLDPVVGFNLTLSLDMKEIAYVDIVSHRDLLLEF